MKEYYEFPSKYKIPRRLPVIVRLDGRAFHSLARKLKFEKPFDMNFIASMKHVARTLVDEVQNTKFAYIQSDEISLLLIDYEHLNTQAWFDGNIQKIASVSAGIASADMSRLLDVTAVFDSRVFVLPQHEVINYFIWRQQDWMRNSIQMIARAYYSHGDLDHLNQIELKEKLLNERGISWELLSNRLKYGACYYKSEVGWHVDHDIPIFTKARGYIEKYVYPEDQE